MTLGFVHFLTIIQECGSASMIGVCVHFKLHVPASLFLPINIASCFCINVSYVCPFQSDCIVLIFVTSLIVAIITKLCYKNRILRC